MSDDINRIRAIKDELHACLIRKNELLSMQEAWKKVIEFAEEESNKIRPEMGHVLKKIDGLWEEEQQIKERKEKKL